jgi:hypothetical protein
MKIKNAPKSAARGVPPQICRTSKDANAMSAKREHQALHPRVIQYADLLGVEPQKLLRLIRRRENDIKLWTRFRAFRRVERNRISLRILRGYGVKKASDSSAKAGATP